MVESGDLARLFYASVLAGVVLALLLAAIYPLPEHLRQRSIINVIPDGGREEVFSVHWPEDRLQPWQAAEGQGIGQAGAAAVLAGPDGRQASVEVFRLRDAEERVIGLASRSTAALGAVDPGSDWVLLIPSRGSLFLHQLDSRDAAPVSRAVESAAFWQGRRQWRITAGPAAGGAGRVAGGSGEFGGLAGSYDEVWQLEPGGDGGASRGRILLTTRLGMVP